MIWIGFSNCYGVGQGDCTDEHIVIPRSISGKLIERLGSFRNNTKLVSITIPSSVNYISDGAFSGCDNLATIYFMGSFEQWNAIDRVEDLTKYGAAVKTYYINGVKVEGNYGIPAGTERICDYVFNGCADLTAVTIPTSVVRIGVGAFYGCSNLTKVYYSGTLAEWCGVSSEKLFSDYGRQLYIGGLKVQGDVIIPDSVTSIAKGVFRGLTELTSVFIPNSVKTINMVAFCDCSATIIWGDNPTVTTIGYHAFYNYSGTSFTIPVSVTEIGSGAFGGLNCNITSFNYAGTIAQWNAIEKSTWIEDIDAYVVHCSDGDIVVE